MHLSSRHTRRCILEVPRVRGGTGRYRAVQGATGRYKVVQGGTGRYRALQGAPRLYRALQGATGRYGAVQGGTGRYKVVQGAAGRHKVVQGAAVPPRCAKSAPRVRQSAPRVRQNSAQGAPEVLPGCTKSAPRVHQMCSQGALKVLPGSAKSTPRRAPSDCFRPTPHIGILQRNFGVFRRHLGTSGCRWWTSRCWTESASCTGPLVLSRCSVQRCAVQTAGKWAGRGQGAPSFGGARP